MILERPCPACGKSIAYNSPGHLQRATAKNSECRSCANKPSKRGACIGSPAPKPWKQIRPYEALFNHFCIVMRGSQLVEIDYDDFLEFTKQTTCCYCGSPVSWTKFNVGKNGAATNLDRKDSSLGYRKDNIVVCCLPCNRSKNNLFTYEEFMVMIRALLQFRASQNRVGVGA
jgi:hypothetical protein